MEHGSSKALDAPDRDAFHVFDTTLRDGAQREGISYSVSDKLAVARLLDELGVGFIEGGWPGAMPKDTEFFARAAAGELTLSNAQLVAFGATRKPGINVADDGQVRALLDSRAPVVCLVAKSDVRHVKEALRTTNEENLAMVRDTVDFLVGNGRRVFVDCEHFFDGYSHDLDYGVTLLKTAFDAGASVGVMCDTNGGMLPLGIYRTVTDVLRRAGVRLGIHCQDDTSCAVANTLAAVEAGVTHVQCTANGYGERTGNADLFSVVASLELKLGIRALPEGRLREAKRISHALADITNLPPNTHQAYVGVSSFAHKAGLHASALKVNEELYSHIDPRLVGNDTRILVTEMAGRATVELKGRELGVDIASDPGALARVVEIVKSRESQGWTYEAADASFELVMRDELPGERRRYFDVESWRTIVSPQVNGDGHGSEAIVKLRAGGQRIVRVGEGNGPVNALDNALRTALEQIYPEVAALSLVDYKVRIVPGAKGTDAVTRVLIQTDDANGSWSTVGVDENVIVASWLAIVDAVDYGLMRAGVRPPGSGGVAEPGEGRPAVAGLGTDPVGAVVNAVRAAADGAIGRRTVRLARYSSGGVVRYGVVEGSEVHELPGHPFAAAGEPLTTTGVVHDLDDVRLLAPVIPSKVIGIGKNYADHAAEMGGPAPENPLMFLKPTTALIGPDDRIVLPPESAEVHFEAELAVVIGRVCRRVPAAAAASVILGYTCANDVTARDLQRADGQWTRAKGFDTFCPLGPWIDTDLDPADVLVECEVNGVVTQSASTATLIDRVPELVEAVSAVMTLLPGDVILTGTPAGVGPLRAGDEVVVTVTGLGTLTNRVH